MAEARFRIADAWADRDALIELNVEYVRSVARGLQEATGMSLEASLGMTIEEYVPGAIEKICSQRPPLGAFYLIEHAGALAGMGGLRRLREDVSEIKRIYIRPAHRGSGLGAAILAKLVDDAREFGYSRVYLDTAPFQKSAHKLYEALGFRDRGPYEGVEAPPPLRSVLRFMELGLTSTAGG